MKIGCMVWMIGNLDLDFWEQIEWIREHGFKEVSFHTCRRYIAGRGIEPDISSRALVTRLKTALSGFSEVDVHAPFNNYDLCFVSPNPLIRQASVQTLAESMRFAAEIEAKTVTFHTGASGSAMSGEEWKDNLKRSLVELDVIAGKEGVRLGIELESDYQVLEEAGVRQVGLTIDTGHLSLNNGAGYREFGTIGGVIRRFSDRIFHLHIHDYDGKSDHLAPGKGSIDFQEIVSALKEIKYRGSLCLELNPERNSTEDWLKSRDFTKSLVSEG